MANPLFWDVFGAYLNEDLKDKLSTCFLAQYSLDLDARVLKLKMESEKYVNRETKLKLSDGLKNALRLEGCHIEYKFEPSAFCEEACVDIANLKMRQ